MELNVRYVYLADERIGDGILPIQLWEARQGQRVTGPRLWAGLGVVLQEPGGQAGKLQDVGSWIPMQRASIPSFPLGEQLAPGRQILTAQSKKKCKILTASVGVDGLKPPS